MATAKPPSHTAPDDGTAPDGDTAPDDGGATGHSGAAGHGSAAEYDDTTEHGGTTGHGGASAAERAAVAAAADRLGLTVGAEIWEGGSPARVHRARAADGGEVVLKVLAAHPGAVDGHDLGSFRGKLHQIRHITDHAPKLAARYLTVLDTIEGDGWAATTTPYLPSEDLGACLRRGDGDEELFFARNADALRALLTDGYGSAAHPTAPGHLDDVHIGRFLRRLPVLEEHLPEVAGKRELVVEGRRLEAPAPLLRRLLETERDRLDALAPARLGFPAHGDTNIRNLLFATEGDANTDVHIIDPRGSTGPWDPVYDIAKILFSLTVWDPMLRLGIRIRRDGPDGGWHTDFRRPVYPGYRSAAHHYLDRLDATGAPALFEGDPHWKQRLLLTHALHVLAEAPCRLSDRKPKPDVGGRHSPPEELALGHYLLGTLLLNDLAAQWSEGAADLDTDRHLAVVTGGPPPP
ncbi:phosphotransferase [Streptomyces malaysiensis subsp. malaysiensis]|uniref:phosphotransferase n=1 Tax=Streptomyces malaysiensis TaxID=92644 RepID=UPI0024BFBF14|nr:phosphotransferase [Streptomyces sp. NA07423]WHX18822.1 phosphotransferase [Streptomyces sp. NA07423]